MFSLRGFFIRIVGNKRNKTIFKKDEIETILVPGGRIGDMVCETAFYIKNFHRLE